IQSCVCCWCNVEITEHTVGTFPQLIAMPACNRGTSHIGCSSNYSTQASNVLCGKVAQIPGSGDASCCARKNAIFFTQTTIRATGNNLPANVQIPFEQQVAVYG